MKGLFNLAYMALCVTLLIGCSSPPSKYYYRSATLKQVQLDRNFAFRIRSTSMSKNKDNANRTWELENHYLSFSSYSLDFDITSVQGMFPYSIDVIHIIKVSKGAKGCSPINDPRGLLFTRFSFQSQENIWCIAMPSLLSRRKYNLNSEVRHTETGLQEFERLAEQLECQKNKRGL